jgi:hypothetical protein
MRRIVSSLAVVALALGMGGCGPKLFDVQGRVTYNGAPLSKPNGRIVFVDANGAQAVAEIAQDGTYLATKVPSGLNKVAVYYPNPAAQGQKRTRHKLGPGETPAPQGEAPPPFLTPSQYASADTSNLSTQVGKGTVFNADLVGPEIP